MKNLLDSMPSYVARIVEELTKGPIVTIFDVAYKGNVDIEL